MATDRDKTQDARVQAFVTELMSVARDFTWSIDRYGQIRGMSHELPARIRPMCPITAVAFKGTGRICTTPHEAAEVLAMNDVGLELTEAIDNFCNHPWRNWIIEALKLAN